MERSTGMNKSKIQAKRPGPAEYIAILAFVVILALLVYFCAKFMATGLPFETLAQ